jgi:hypothetical protein
MNRPHGTEFSLAHRLDASKVTQYLAHALHCDYWHVVCHQEHQLVIHLSGGHADRYAVSFECTPPVDKGIYHGCLAWQLAIRPLHGQPDLTPSQIEELKTALAHDLVDSTPS